MKTVETSEEDLENISAKILKLLEKSKQIVTKKRGKDTVLKKNKHWKVEEAEKY
jgi:hypothetical protein